MFHAATAVVAARAVRPSRPPRRPTLPASPTSAIILVAAAFVAAGAAAVGAIGPFAGADEDEDHDEESIGINDRHIERWAPSSSGWMTPAGTRCSCDSGVGVGVVVGGGGGGLCPPPSSEMESRRLPVADEEVPPGDAGPASPRKGDVVVVAPPPPPRGQVQLIRLFPSSNDEYDDAPRSVKESAPLRNGVLLIPDVLSPGECALLRGEANRLLEGGAYRRDRNIDDDGYGEEDDDEEEVNDDDDEDRLRRVSLCDMSRSAREFSRKVIFERVLPTLERYSGPSSPSSLCRDLGLGGWDSPDAVLEWASDEPSVNVYTAPGGRFDPHRDGYALTLIVLLSEGGAFDGGGTEFFSDCDNDDGTVAGPITEDVAGCSEEGGQRRSNSSVLLRPPQGTAVCFDGDVTHAGSPVLRGIRHLYVASFGIVNDDKV